MMTVQYTDSHLLIGMFTFIISIAGLCVAFAFRRPQVFRMKLCLVFSLPFISGVGGMMLPIEQFGTIQHLLNLSFMYLLTILYWREIKAFMTTAGYHRGCLANYTDDNLDMIWIKDIDERYTYANKAFLRLLRIKSKDIMGKRDVDLKKNYLNERISLHVCRSPLYNDHSVKKLIGYMYIGREMTKVKDEEIFFDNDHYIMHHQY